MSSSGIVINSPKDITISADQKVNITGKMGVAVKSSAGDVTIDGLNIKETAEMEYAAKGNMTAKINAGMELTLQATMIMIN